MLAPYDSPTHLGQKDKYMMGFSLPELIVCFLIFGVSFGICMALPYNILIQCGIAIPMGAISVFLLFFKKWGLSVPHCLYYLISRTFKKPVYEDVAEVLISGPPAWLAMQHAKEEGVVEKKKKLRFIPTMGSKRVRDSRQAVVDNKDLLATEAERTLDEGARAVDGWLREGIRIVMKG